MNKIVIVCMVLMALVIPVSAANTVSIGDYVNESNNPPNSQRIPIWLNDSQNINAVWIILTFNSSIVDIDSLSGIDKGDWDTYFPFPALGGVIKTLEISTLNLAGDPITGLPVGLTGNKIIGYINIKAKGKSCDSTPLTLTVKNMIDANGIELKENALVSDGSFTILGNCNVPPVPEVPTMILVAAGMIGLIGIGRLRNK